MTGNDIVKSSGSLALITLVLLPFFQGLLLAQTQPEDIGRDRIMLEDFQEGTVGEFPAGWYDRDGNKLLLEHDAEVVKNYNYRIDRENRNKFLRYEGVSAKHINFPFINKDERNIHNIDIYDTPVLSWKVRAHSLPQNANEDSNDRNDAVASIYVVFDFGRIALFKKVPKTIRYTWSSTLKKGTETSKLFGNQNIVVVESGYDRIGEWVTFERNLVADYRKLFGDDPPGTPLAILILSDGDSTDSYVKADYDDIMLKREAAVMTE